MSEDSATGGAAASEPTTQTATQTTTTNDVATADASVLGGAGVTDGVAATTADAADSAIGSDGAQSAAPAVPERYELALEGMTIDPALVEAADPVLRDLGLSNEAANKLLPVAQKVQEATREAVLSQLADAGAAQKKAWLDAFVADPEIGGAKREETQGLAAKALDALGFAAGHPFRDALNETGFGNHPDMIRAFRRLGEMVGEDGAFVRSHVGGADTRPVWDRLYPNEAK
jgi:hypothetical protein